MRSKRAALPLVVLHGGPGIPHDYLLPLAGLAESAGGRAVFFYDQLGSGNSDSPQDEEFYSVEQCAQDVVTTLEHFAANEDLVARGGFHLYGHSWGGCLAAETLLRHAGESSLLKSKLASVTLASTPTGPDAAMNAARELIEKYKAELSAKPMEERNMRADWPREPEYIEQWLLQEANRMFQEEHNMRGVVKDPECLNQAMSKAGEVWRGAWVAGGWAVDAAELERGWPKGLRATVLRGEHDFLTKADVAPYLEGIKGAEYVELPGLSHMAHLEDSPLYLETLEACLRRGDAEWAARS